MAIQFDVQRNINPDGLPIGDWIAEQTRRLKAAHLQASSVEVGGRQAIRWERVDTFGRKFTVFVALNRTDVFQITAYQTEATKQLDPTYAAIVSTIRFPD